MKILNNKEELNRLFELHNNVVKSEYKTTFDKFCDWIDNDGCENIESGECFVEIPSNETISGNPVILDW